MFCKTVLLKISSFFLIISQVLAVGPATLLKKIPGEVIACEFCDIFKRSFFIEHLRETRLGNRESKNRVTKSSYAK